jgi:poly(3-hydroxybutyrate) depolymerase
MRLIKVLAASALILTSGLLHAGVKTRTYKFEPTGEKIQYGLYLPGRLDKTRPIPLVIALHGSGGSPDSILKPLGAAAEKYHYIVAAPMGYVPAAAYGFMRRMAGPAERENSRLSELDVMNVLEIVRREYNIDPLRIYVVGASMGGVGAVHLAAKYPDLWAAIGVISPAITPNTPEEFLNYPGLPVAVAHGDHDSTVAIDLVRAWVGRLRASKVPEVYFEYQGGTHGSVVKQCGEKIFGFLDMYSREQPPVAP